MLLAGRIWTITRRSAQYRSTDIFSPVLRVIIESGAIYSMTITAALISFVIKSNGVYVILDMVRILVEGHEAVARTARELFPLADQASDEPTADLLTQRLTVHEQTAWMLRSLLEE